MELKELEKIICLSFLFGLAAPALAVLSRGRPLLQRGLFGLLCVMIPSGLVKPQEWGLTLGALEDFYRGHSTGYHFYFAEAIALALVLARALEDWRDFRLLPPGLWLYLAHCGLAALSIINAPNTSFALMAAFKAVKICVVFIAGYNFLRSRENIQFFLIVMVGVVGIQLMAALRQRYLLGVYQVTGTFEHQNSLAMFVNLIGMVFLSISLAPEQSRSQVNLYLAAYLGCAAVVESTFSRGGMVIFAAGSIGVGLLSLVDRMTRRRWTVLAFLGIVGAVGLAMSLDTIRARFQDYGNQSSGKTRELLNQASRNMVEDHPLGIGWNNFALLINRPFPYGNIIDEWELEGGVTIDPHHQKGLVESLYYLLLAETGWQGLISFVLFMALFLWWNLRGGIAFRYSFIGSLQLGIAAGCTCNYLQSTLERVLIQPRNMMLWLLLLALTARLEVWRRAEAKARREQGRSTVFVEDASLTPALHS